MPNAVDAVTAEPLAVFLAGARARVDAALERWLPVPPACPAIVSEAMRYSVFAGGKRLRPMLTLAAAMAVEEHGERTAEAVRHESKAPVAHGFSRAIDAEPPRRAIDAEPRLRAFDAALPAACAIELLHTYSLIHDDLPAMDDDTLRRGRPTLHIVYGDGIAILAGAGLHAEAFTLLAREPASADPDISRRKLEVIRLVGDAAGAGGMVG